MATTNTPAPETQLAGFIAKFAPGTATLMREVRKQNRSLLKS